VFARHLEAPLFDPAAAPALPVAQWPKPRLEKAYRNYAMEYVRTAAPVMVQLFGPDAANHLLHLTGKLIGMQYFDEIARGLSAGKGNSEAFAVFLQAWQEAFLLLATKHPEHEFAGIRRPAPRHHREDESGEVGMIQFGDASPSQPLHLLRAFLLCGHFRSPCSADLAGCEHTRPRRHAKFAASEPNAPSRMLMMLGEEKACADPSSFPEISCS